MQLSILLRRFTSVMLPGAMIALANPALACQGPYDATTMMLSTTPPLEPGDIAMEVEVSSEDHVSPIEARVLKVLSGQYSGDRVTIARSSCDSTKISKGMQLVVTGCLWVRSSGTLFMPFDERLMEPRTINQHRQRCRS